MITHVFLDMDGVLCDFMKAAIDVHKCWNSAALWPAGVRWHGKHFGVTEAQFWAKIDAEGAAFWSNLEPCRWFESLVCLFRGLPVTVASCPSFHPSSVRGKLSWLNRHFWSPFRQYCFTPQKHLLAGPGRLLIDDWEDEVEKWRAAGGSAILFPQRWNANHELVNDRMGHVLQECAKLGLEVDRSELADRVEAFRKG